LREIGSISPKVLTQTLRELESYGLIEREVFPVIPPKVQYGLTAMGNSLMDNNAAVEASIDAYNQRQDEDDFQNF